MHLEYYCSDCEKYYPKEDYEEDIFCPVCGNSLTEVEVSA